MKTLTITDAKKNLSRWLDAAARGQDVGIIRGADIIALRRVEVESTDYAQREYRGKMNAHLADLRARSRGAGLDYFLLPTDRPLDAALGEYLTIRHRRN